MRGRIKLVSKYALSLRGCLRTSQALNIHNSRSLLITSDGKTPAPLLQSQKGAALEEREQRRREADSQVFRVEHNTVQMPNCNACKLQF